MENPEHPEYTMKIKKYLTRAINKYEHSKLK
jgi:hypothetical protein